MCEQTAEQQCAYAPSRRSVLCLCVSVCRWYTELYTTLALSGLSLPQQLIPILAKLLMTWFVLHALPFFFISFFFLYIYDINFFLFSFSFFSFLSLNYSVLEGSAWWCCSPQQWKFCNILGLLSSSFPSPLCFWSSEHNVYLCVFLYKIYIIFPFSMCWHDAS